MINLWYRPPQSMEFSEILRNTTLKIIPATRAKNCKRWTNEYISIKFKNADNIANGSEITFKISLKFHGNDNKLARI